MSTLGSVRIRVVWRPLSHTHCSCKIVWTNRMTSKHCNTCSFTTAEMTAGTRHSHKRSDDSCLGHKIVVSGWKDRSFLTRDLGAQKQFLRQKVWQCFEQQFPQRVETFGVSQLHQKIAFKLILKLLSSSQHLQFYIKMNFTKQGETRGIFMCAWKKTWIFDSLIDQLATQVWWCLFPLYCSSLCHSQYSLVPCVFSQAAWAPMKTSPWKKNISPFLYLCCTKLHLKNL